MHLPTRSAKESSVARLAQHCCTVIKGATPYVPSFVNLAMPPHSQGNSEPFPAKRTKAKAPDGLEPALRWALTALGFGPPGTPERAVRHSQYVATLRGEAWGP
jgi:hypothetical protein